LVINRTCEKYTDHAWTVVFHVALNYSELGEEMFVSYIKIHLQHNFLSYE